MEKNMVQPDQPDPFLVEQLYSFTQNGDGKPTFFYVQPNVW